jgi:hypothetical protein
MREIAFPFSAGKPTDEEAAAVIFSVAHYDGGFTEQEVEDIAEWINDVMADTIICRMILNGHVAAKFVNGTLTLRNIPKTTKEEKWERWIQQGIGP